MWNAIATSKGISSWLFPADVEEREGGDKSQEAGSRPYSCEEKDDEETPRREARGGAVRRRVRYLGCVVTSIVTANNEGAAEHDFELEDGGGTGIVAEGKYLTRGGVKDPKAIFNREVEENLALASMPIPERFWTRIDDGQALSRVTSL